MKKYRFVILITMLLGFGCICMNSVTEKAKKSSIVINEVCNRNTGIMSADGFLKDDYIELYNTTGENVSLNGWWLSDDGENLQKYCLPDIFLEAGAFVVFCTDEELGGNTLNFKIALEGEEIFLSSPEGQLMDQVFVPKMEMNYAYARQTDGGDIWSVMEGSPSESNKNGAVVKSASLEAPEFSHQSGFYEEGFTLSLAAKKDQNIYYTTDGSVPTEESQHYNQGIEITEHVKSESILNSLNKVVLDWNDYEPTREKTDKATVIRAIVIDSQGNQSKVITKTYFVGLEQYKDKNVLSVVAEPEKLIGENGIFVTGTEYDNWYLKQPMSIDGIYEQYRSKNYETANFFGHGREYEVISELQLFENGILELQQPVGLKVQGNTTRLEPKKSLQLVSRNVYSESVLFQKQIFEKYDSHAVYAVKNREKAYLMNLAKERNLGIQEAKECVVFVNGEYWYTAALMEKYDEAYFEQHYGVNPDNVLMIKDTVAELGESYQHLYDDLINYLRDESVSQEEKGQYLYEQIDVQSLIDWLCLNLYLGNDDVSYKKNSVLWRTIETESGPYGDCLWRWNWFDIDHAAVGAMPESADFSEFSIISDNRFYWGLRTVPTFCQQFVLTAMDMMNTNLSIENIETILSAWGLDLSYSNDYFLKRPEYMIQSLKNEFDLTGTLETVVLDSNFNEAGSIYINTVQADISEGAWKGYYFTDYPVTITAVANPGYQFIGWSGDMETMENSICVSLKEGGVALTALFQKTK